MANPLYDALFAPHHGKSTPFLIAPDGKVRSHDDFLKQAARLAHALMAMGLQPGDRLAVQVEKTEAALALYAAAVQSGVVFLPLNSAYTVDELRYFIEDSQAGLVVCDQRMEGELTPIASGLGAKLLTLNADGHGSLMVLADDQADVFPTAHRQSDDLAALLYTSGTTGRSKGAMLSQRNLLSNAQTLVDHWRFTADDRLIHALPIFHTHGLFVASNVTLLAGCSMVFMPKFDRDAIIAAMPHSTALMGVPTFYTRLLDDDRLNQDLTKGMRLFISGSAPLLAETHLQFEERTGHRILERYGMTETNMNTTNPYEGERRAGTVGFPLSGVELKITDPETGKALPKGEIGLIEVRGENVFQGYWNMPEKTKEDLREDGFFITGDLAKYDADGYVTIVGRQKDLIISGGFNVYPKEIETVLDDQADVKESAVVGLEHPDFGEGVVAFVVMQEWAEVNEDQLIAALGQELAKYKTPKRIIALEELPRNTMGKVQKNVLRDGYRELFLN